MMLPRGLVSFGIEESATSYTNQVANIQRSAPIIHKATRKPELQGYLLTIEVRRVLGESPSLLPKYRDDSASDANIPNGVESCQIPS